MAQLNTGIVIPLFRKLPNGFQKVFITAKNIMLKDNKTTLQDKIDTIDHTLNDLSRSMNFGNYGKEWRLVGEYWDIGNNMPSVNDWYQSNCPHGDVIIKKAGTYLCCTRSTITSSGATQVDTVFTINHSIIRYFSSTVGVVPNVPSYVTCSGIFIVNAGDVLRVKQRVYHHNTFTVTNNGSDRGFLIKLQ